VVIVPGWTMTIRYFARQLEHYADSEQVQLIVYDPRAHGRSSKTLEGADYARHARDLRQFIDALELKDVVLAGWSWGGITVYAYLDAFGTENISAAVLIDQTPTPLATGSSPWVDGDRAAVKGFFDAFVPYQRYQGGHHEPPEQRLKRRLVGRWPEGLQGPFSHGQTGSAPRVRSAPASAASARPASASTVRHRSANGSVSRVHRRPARPR
jgi:pimeloyl-ACP methyl ester carboxylesterase